MKTATLLLTCLIAAATSAANPEAKPAPATPDATQLAKGANTFAAELYGRLADTPGNLFFSPASIQTALGMTYAGAGGDTATQMAKTLHFTLTPDKLNPAFAAMIAQWNNPAKVRVFDGDKTVEKPAYQLSVANALWGQQGYDFKPGYLGLLKDSYRAGLNPLDFRQSDAARTTINDWVAKETHDKIKDLIPAGLPTPDTRLVLTNAIYFKSDWARKFDKHATADEKFVLAADKNVTVPMMNLQSRFGYAETAQVQALSMPYQANQLDMVVLLPKKADGLADVEKSLAAGKLEGWLQAIKPGEVKVTLPKFKFSAQFKLADALKAMGMPLAFSDKADFSGITTSEALQISDVLHKAFVAVDENGTEAAAATAVMMMATAMPIEPPQPKIFKADHPFVFVIRHHATGAILFMGRVSNPKE